MIRALLAAALLAVTSCALPEEPPAEAPSPETPGADAQPDATRLYVYRTEKGTVTPRTALPVQLDGRPLTQLRKNEYVSVQVDAGEHRLTAPGQRIGFSIAENDTLYCRISPVLDSPVVAWEIHCSPDADRHGDLESCGKGYLDPTVDWQE